MLMTALLIGAVVRLTRLVTTDRVFDKPRNWLVSQGGAVAYFASCDWCVSIYWGLLVFSLAELLPSDPVFLVAGALTASLVAGWLGLIEALVHSALFDNDDRD